MVIKVDKNKGLIKVYWEDVYKHIAKIEPMFAKIVDSLGIKLVRTIMILIVFLPMLWNFSKLVDPTIIDLLKTADLSDYWLFLPAIIMFALTIDFFVADKRTAGFFGVVFFCFFAKGFLTGTLFVHRDNFFCHGFP